LTGIARVKVPVETTSSAIEYERTAAALHQFAVATEFDLKCR
jgi:hypothetical protein